MHIHLRDINPELVAAWQLAFANLPNVTVSEGDIFAQPADAIVSPANSFGYMDGGIDRVYSHYFGWELETRLRDRIKQDFHGELPVGQAVIVATEHHAIPLLVSAPTMRVPGDISQTVNVYLAFRAALIAVVEHNWHGQQTVASLLAPGFGTGIGNVPPERAARQMRAAYDAILAGEGLKKRAARQVLIDHHGLLG